MIIIKLNIGPGLPPMWTNTLTDVNFINGFKSAGVQAVGVYTASILSHDVNYSICNLISTDITFRANGTLVNLTFELQLSIASGVGPGFFAVYLSLPSNVGITGSASWFNALVIGANATIIPTNATTDLGAPDRLHLSLHVTTGPQLPFNQIICFNVTYQSVGF